MDNAIVVAPAEQEQWLPVVGWEGFYEVSDLGRVRAVERIITVASNGQRRRWKARVLRPAASHYYKSRLSVALCRNGKPQSHLVHGLVWRAFRGPIQEGLMLDHKDRNRFNNRLDNLRLATLSQNGANSRLSRANTSGYKRVCWNKTAEKWQADIMVNRKQFKIGLYDTKEEAAEAYRVAALHHFGEFANPVSAIQ